MGASKPSRPLKHLLPLLKHPVNNPRHLLDICCRKHQLRHLLHFFPTLEGGMFHTLEELNQALQQALTVFNDRKLTGRNQSHRQLFESVEKDYLRPLRAVRHQMKQRKSLTVMRNSYVTLEKHHYSEPIKYIGIRVELVYDEDTVTIFHGLSFVTSHLRVDTPYTYTQKRGA